MNKLSEKEFRLLEYLERNPGEFFASQFLADLISVSDRTARKYLKNIQSFLENHGAEIQMKKGSGYQLIIHNSAKYINDIIRVHQNAPFKIRYEEKSDRQLKMLNQLLINEQHLSFDELMDMVHLGETATHNLLHDIGQSLSAYDLLLKHEDDAFFIEGSERNKRNYILDYFWRDNQYNLFGRDLQNDDDRVNPEKIFMIVLDECRKQRFQISDYELSNLVLHLSLATERLKLGHELSDKANIFSQKDIFNSSETEMKVAKKVIKKIEDYYDVGFPDAEINYVVAHLKAKINTQMNIRKDDFDDAERELRQLLIKINQESPVKLSIDRTLINGILQHMGPLLNRLRYDIPLKNPLIAEIKETYSEILEISIKYLSHFSLLENYHLSLDEWAYLVIHILASHERQNAQNKIKVTVICSTGLGSAQMLKSRLENEFGSRIEILNVVGFYQLSNELLADTDLIVSTIDISNRFFNIPIVYVNVFLTDTDIQKINEYLRIFHEKSDKTLEEIEDSQNILFDDFFTEERFIVFHHPAKKDEVLYQLISTLSDAKDEQFVSDFMQQIDLREQLGSLVFEKNIAFPHPAKLMGNVCEIAVGIIPDGIHWDAETNDVRIVILLSPSKYENKGLEDVVQRLIRFMSSDEAKQKLIHYPSFGNLIDLLKN